MVELNYAILKTIQTFEAYLLSFKDDNMNERKEWQVINEAMLWKMTVGIPQRKPTHSTNRFKK